VLFDSEGDLLMSLGILPTIAEQAPANFYHFLLDNECYATTGGQPVPNAKNVAYDVIARGCGYPRAFAFDQLEDFQANIASILAQPGPVFVALIQKGPDARRRPTAAGEAYSLYVEPAAKGANEADGPFSASCDVSRGGAGGCPRPSAPARRSRGRARS
jgi:thiamine pyrophosphate-dependent acetolactate synthase large subunit-like protein